jgi:hypothetical protein
LARGKIRVDNKYDFVNLDFVTMSWEVTEDGEVLQSERNVKLSQSGPQQQKEITLPLRKFTPQPGREYLLKVQFALAKNLPWAKRGHIVAWDQFKLPLDAGDAPKAAIASMGDLKFEQSAEAVTVTGKDFTLRVSGANGAIDSFKYKGDELISRPLVPNFWRPPIDNDNGNKMPQRLGVWKNAAPQRKMISLNAEHFKGRLVRIVADSKLPAGGGDYRNTYIVYGNGDVIVQAHLSPSAQLPNMPRFGMQMAMPAEFDRITWYGRGPHETYWDRKTGAVVGTYSRGVEKMVHEYVRPQENANRTDIRWFALTSDSGAGLIAIGRPLLSCSAWPYTMEALEGAKHIHELPRDSAITVNIDYKQMGVGGDNSWGARTHPEYTLGPKNYTYRFYLRPFKADTGLFGLRSDKAVKDAAGRPLPQDMFVEAVVVERDKKAVVTMTCPTPDADIRYTLDNSIPTASSGRYDGAFDLPEGGVVKARAFADNMIKSDVNTVQFRPLLKADWNVVHVDSYEPSEGLAVHAIDDNPDTFWHTNWSGSRENFPHEIQIDLGKEYNLAGFTYLPRQNMQNGRIGEYEFYVSADGKNYAEAVHKGRFQNTRDLQTVKLEKSVKGRFIRIVALSEVTGAFYTSIAEVDIIIAE